MIFLTLICGYSGNSIFWIYIQLYIVCAGKILNFLIFRIFVSFSMISCSEGVWKLMIFYDLQEFPLARSRVRAGIIEKRTKIRKNKKFNIFRSHKIHNRIKIQNIEFPEYRQIRVKKMPMARTLKILLPNTAKGRFRYLRWAFIKTVTISGFHQNSPIFGWTVLRAQEELEARIRCKIKLRVYIFWFGTL